MPGFELFGDEERKEVNDVMSTGILMRYGFEGARQGMWKSRELEAAICARTGAGYAQLVSSGTAALTAGLAAIGVGAGDEVIMPSFTFVASFEAILSVGAVPVLADVNETLTLDPASVRRAITPHTKCIMPVHMCGSMADLDALQAICREHGLLMMEDACQSLGATYKGRSLGTFGDAGMFSFDFVKTVTCGEGGVVLTNDPQIKINADGYSDHGHDHEGADRGAEQHPFPGYNFRISELHAAVGLAQFRKLDRFLEIQKKNHRYLKSALGEVPEVSFRKIPDPEGDSHTFVSWFLPTAGQTQAFVREMKARNSYAGNFYWFEHNWHYVRKWDHLKEGKSLYPLTAAQRAGLAKIRSQNFTASDQIMSRGISTAINLGWTEEQLAEKAKIMVSVLKNVLATASLPKHYTGQGNPA